MLVSARQTMLTNLVADVLPGKDRGQIENLLGPSLDTPYFKGIDKDLIYYLGPERSSSIQIDSESLLIWLDDRGRFLRYGISVD